MTRTAIAVLAALAVLHAAAPLLAATGEVEADTFISDAERFPGWKGTLPGVKYADDAAKGDPNRARTLAHGSLGEVSVFHAAVPRRVSSMATRCHIHC